MEKTGKWDLMFKAGRRRRRRSKDYENVDEDLFLK